MHAQKRRETRQSKRNREPPFCQTIHTIYTGWPDRLFQRLEALARVVQWLACVLPRILFRPDRTWSRVRPPAWVILLGVFDVVGGFAHGNVRTHHAHQTRITRIRRAGTRIILAHTRALHSEHSSRTRITRIRRAGTRIILAHGSRADIARISLPVLLTHARTSSLACSPPNDSLLRVGQRLWPSSFITNWGIRTSLMCA